MKVMKFFMTFFLLVAIETQGAVINAKSGSRTDIQAAINLTKTGDIVQVPAGTFSFDGSISIKAGISIIGAGQDRTILNRTGSTSSYTFTIDGSNGLPSRISGMTIKGRAPTKSPGIKLVNSCKNFRIDHMSFKRCFDRAIETHGDCQGVIDHNIFIDNWYTAVVVYGDESVSWNKSLDLGGSDAVFIEDNYFEQKNVDESNMSHHVASNNGSKYVFRYNTISDGYLSPQAIDVHGNKFGGERGSRSYEIYNNKIEATHRWLGMLIRGGDGVIFGNELLGDYTRPIDLMHEGDAGDGNCSYPCTDQIRKLYMWDNTYKGKASPVNVRYPNLIKEGRDYFMNKMPGYVPYTYPHPLVVDAATAVIGKVKSGSKEGMSLDAGSNAFRGTGTIRYSIPGGSGEKMLVRLNIYNAQGKLVRKLFNGSVSSGHHEALWDGYGESRVPLANGIYSVELRVNGSRVVDNVMLYR